MRVSQKSSCKEKWMQYFSGFGFCNEKILFVDYLKRSEFVIAGFSYGAQKALQEAIKRVQEGKRVDTLQLLSPAFFNYLPKAIKHKEIVNFVKNKELYMRFFYKKACYPAKLDIQKLQCEPTLAELKELLLYEWREKDLAFLQKNGVVIEVFVGTEDKIVQSKEVENFFSLYATVYSMKGVGHCLH